MSLRKQIVINTFKEILDNPNSYSKENNPNLEIYPALDEIGFIMNANNNSENDVYKKSNKFTLSKHFLPSETLDSRQGILRKIDLPTIMKVVEKITSTMNSKESALFPNLSRRNFLKAGAGTCTALALSPVTSLFVTNDAQAGEITTLSSQILLNNPLGHHGKPIDPATGLYRYGEGYRLYNPNLGIFMQYDHDAAPFGSGGINGYAFCYNSPLTFIDPDGRSGKFINWFKNIGHNIKAAWGNGGFKGFFSALTTLITEITPINIIIKEVGKVFFEGEALAKYISTVDQILAAAFNVSLAIATGPAAPLALAACAAGLVSASLNMAAIHINDPTKARKLQTSGMIFGLASDLASMGNGLFKTPGVGPWSGYNLAKMKPITTSGKAGKFGLNVSKKSGKLGAVSEVTGAISGSMATTGYFAGNDTLSQAANIVGTSAQLGRLKAYSPQRDKIAKNNLFLRYSRKHTFRAKQFKEGIRAVRTNRSLLTNFNINETNSMHDNNHLARC
ncbi:RHS repeat-associated core domain-containing protein [Photobacterium minamisatsumaniensis]|uniref:RHS repeat-associated core domain-containing protein n=1 Tax=Photobacterium minamisatsumaniensis TaxID=2910233 RepID=UPI003D0E348B